MDESTIVEKVLRSMTPRFNYVVCSIEESNNVNNLAIDGLQSSLLVHEQRKKEKKDDATCWVTETEFVEIVSKSYSPIVLNFCLYKKNYTKRILVYEIRKQR